MSYIVGISQPLLRNGPQKTIEFGEITQNYGHYDVQGYSKVTDFDSISKTNMRFPITR